MITTNLGQGVPSHARIPFNRPRPASPQLMPHLLRTRFSTHLHPMESALPGAGSFQPNLPRGSGYMRPGSTASGHGYPQPQQARGRRAAPRGAAPRAPAPGPTAGYFRDAYEDERAPYANPYRGGTQGHPYTAPYTTAVTRALMPFRQDPRHIRGGVLTAPNLIRRAHAPGFPYVSQPAGYFRDTAY